MSGLNRAPGAVILKFDEAAERYDAAAIVQMQIAQRLVDWAAPPVAPVDVLDLGSGTGLVAEAVARRWPQARLTALDTAPAMLLRAQRKLAGLKVIRGDAATIDIAKRFDAVFSSMMLHWLAEPCRALRRWSRWLNTGGCLNLAVLADGSFKEWRELCAATGGNDGLWTMLDAGFADGIASRSYRETIPVTYPSAAGFLHNLKAIGAATPRLTHTPFSAAKMRLILEQAPRPFTVSYDVLYIEVDSSRSV